MGKNIVVCCDGTGNDNLPANRQSWTNVAKILHDSIYDSPHQKDKSNALYISGIGTHGFIERVLGPGVGYGIEQNIKDAYRHICALYEEGKDHIYFFGFSRGAYTVRSLAGFVKKVGLLLNKKSDKQIQEAYMYYFVGEQVGDGDMLKEFLRHIKLPEQPPEGQQIFVYFIGVWDTVGALGPPGVLGKPFQRWVKYHKVELPDHVTFAYQALALHELRALFPPVFWTKKAGSRQTLEQVWFAGAHADVGGGYDDRRALADIALKWMQSKAYAADKSAQRLNIIVGGGMSPKEPAADEFQPHNTIVDVFEALNPIPRALFRNEYDLDLLGGVWHTIKLHESVKNYWSNIVARDYKYGIPAVNEQLRKIDDRSVRFHAEQFSKYNISFATDD